MELESPDLFIVGAGPVGCVVAERAAHEKGWSSLVIDRRSHIAGNCFDSTHESGVLIHNYGPHYFRTSNDSLMVYLSRFTDWIPGNYRAKAKVGNQLFQFPININTLEKFFQRSLDEVSARKLLNQRAENISSEENSEEFLLKRIGRELYEAFYLGYTQKQWGAHPRDLAPSVCGRVPIRFNRDDSYVDGKYQKLPRQGYTKLFERMLDSPHIRLELNRDFFSVRSKVKPKVATVFCGPMDEFFEYKLGALAWRSLNFEHQFHKKAFVQPCVQINYPQIDLPHTRTIEIKHISGQVHDGTVVTTECPAATGQPFYPVPSAKSQKLYGEYQQLAKVTNQDSPVPVYFVGRLASYKYINIDQAIEMALECFSTICLDQKIRKRV